MARSIGLNILPLPVKCAGEGFFLMGCIYNYGIGDSSPVVRNDMLIIGGINPSLSRSLWS